jgi:predicted DNA-binding protein YlxM (UPF0122 family)
MFQTKVLWKSKDKFYIEQILSDNLAVYEIMGVKYGTARQATDDNITRRRKDAHCMPDN